MKKIFMTVAVAAMFVLSFASCVNKTQDTQVIETVDSTAVAAVDSAAVVADTLVVDSVVAE